MSIEQRGQLPYTFSELMANVAEHGPLSASGKTVEILVAKGVKAELDFTYVPASEDDPAEVRFHAVKASDDFKFAGLHMDLEVRAGFDLMEFLPELEVEKLKEFIIKRAGGH